MLRIYLDNCCFNRPFDDQSQIKIHLESTAKLYIQKLIKDGVYDLVWSYMLDFENGNNPYEDKRNAIQIWKDIAVFNCKSSQEIFEQGKEYEKLNIAPKDALHIACAVHSNCDYFITTDIPLLRKHIEEIRIITPIDFIGEMEAKNED